MPRCSTARLRTPRTCTCASTEAAGPGQAPRLPSKRSTLPLQVRPATIDSFQSEARLRCKGEVAGVHLTFLDVGVCSMCRAAGRDGCTGWPALSCPVLGAAAVCSLPEMSAAAACSAAAIACRPGDWTCSSMWALRLAGLLSTACVPVQSIRIRQCGQEAAAGRQQPTSLGVCACCLCRGADEAACLHVPAARCPEAGSAAAW